MAHHNYQQAQHLLWCSWPAYHTLQPYSQLMGSGLVHQPASIASMPLTNVWICLTSAPSISLLPHKWTSLKTLAWGEWECKEAEDFAVCTNSKNYHMHIFAFLAIKSWSPTLTEAIHHHIGHDICLLNDGALSGPLWPASSFPTTPFSTKWSVLISQTSPSKHVTTILISTLTGLRNVLIPWDNAIHSQT